jgi:3-oxoadipate enol-lactonase
VPFLELQDASIHYEFDEIANCPVLVLSHSLGTNLSMWSAQIHEFAKHFSILRYDSRGHGQSSVPPGPYSIAQMGRDVVALLDERGLSRVHFCGLSMGGMVGQWLGVNAPHRFDKLVLSNTAAKIGNESTWNQRIETVLQHGIEAVIPSILERWYTESFRASFPAEVARTSAMLQSMNREGYASSCAAVRDMDQREDVKKISLPTLVIFGTEDPVTPRNDARFLAENIASAHLLGLPAAHLANIEAASAFTEGVIDFLLGHGPDNYPGQEGV